MAEDGGNEGLDVAFGNADAAYRPFPSFEQFMAGVHVDEAVLSYYTSQLEMDRLHTSFDVGLRTIIRAAAFDTGAVEDLYTTDRGTTFTIARMGARWEDAVEKSGDLAAEIFAAQLGVYERLREWDGEEPITEAFIRDLHASLCAPQTTYSATLPDGTRVARPLSHGAYKVEPNHVMQADGGLHSYAPVAVTPHEIRRLVDETRSVAFIEADFVAQAAYVHYAVTVVHPFEDGNGRVSRALASVFTYRGIGMPLVLLRADRTRYLDALEAADQGDFSEFIGLMLRLVVDGSMMVHDELGRPSDVERPDSVARRLSDLLAAGAAHDRLEQRAGDLTAMINNVADEVVRSFGLQDPIRVSVVATNERSQGAIEGYRGPRAPQTARRVTVSYSSPAPADATVRVFFEVLIANQLSHPAPYLVRCTIAGVQDFQVTAIEAAAPAFDTPSLHWRLENWIRPALATGLADFERKVIEKLDAKGLSH